MLKGCIVVDVQIVRG